MAEQLREMFTLYPAGDCEHCGEAINETHMIEMSVIGDRLLTILVHTGTGHERCEGRMTLAVRRPCRAG